MESMRKRMKMELVTNEKRLQKLINKSTFKHATYYRENLIAVSLENKIIKFDKPIYIGKYTLKVFYYTVSIHFLFIFYFYRICSIGYFKNLNVRLSL